VPKLAESWLANDGGARWRFTLRSDARFADGQPVTATAAAEAWVHRRSAMSLQFGISPLLANLVVEGDRTLSVSTEDTSANLPRVFGTVALGIGQTARNPRWPTGTGPYALDTIVSGSRHWVLRPVVAGGPILDVRIDPATDPRDLLDRGADLLATRDPVAIEYARRNEAFAVHALPWDRTYALAITSRRDAATTVSGPALSAADQLAFRSALARDAVRADSRPAAPQSEWWSTSAGCADQLGAPPTRNSIGAPPRRIMYSPDDPVAKSLAERLVALTGDVGPHSAVLKALAPELAPEAGGPVTAAPANGLSRSVGDDLAYIVSIPHHTSSRCMALRTLRPQGRWMHPSKLIPLIDTRPSLIARRGVPLLSVDWEGTLRVHPTGRPNADPP
jgi:hypothetical protein